MHGAAIGIWIAPAARLLTLMALAPAAVVRNRRRVETAGVFVGGVLSTLSAWVMGFVRPSWLGLEPGRKLTLPLGLFLG